MLDGCEESCRGTRKNCKRAVGLTMSKIQITLKKSLIGRLVNQIRTVEALGLRGIGSSVEKEPTPEVLGMLNVINHMVEVRELS